ncbi:MAG TPA: glycine cleavage system protein GcvH [Alphaproteobacteria bacterium]|nr:glycine cleavage system protein GcvH [Alphaproteobacteria bacterium]HAJ48086.1 glycine cleavage system protein GcvH [Alphaproteobacteria bacterium]
MSERRYTKDHEWISLNGDVATIGITPYAAQQLGDVVFVDLPLLGKKVDAKGEAAVVESVKAASEVYAPMSGEVVAVNDALTGEPAKVNADPAGEGWFLKLKISNRGEWDGLMTDAQYQSYIKELG